MNTMPDILREICEAKRAEVEKFTPEQVKRFEKRLRAAPPVRDFRTALSARSEVALIAEVKKASPSAGVIREDFSPEAISRAYRQGGASCISVLTDREYFQGCMNYLKRVRKTVDLPILRKDFILDEVQILEARAGGADCVLLIVAALRPARLKKLLMKTRELQMDALVEVHTAEELEVASDMGADLIGINNRDLHTFEVDLGTTRDLASEAGEEVVLVSESGIETRDDVLQLKQAGVDAILVGESLMRSENIVETVDELSDV
ncbi:MAG: indole-3-glycerol phosphate synthase TrpC [Planctomycetota bacterium]